MITQFQIYLTFENIYLWTNIIIFPIWVMLIFIPNIRITQIITNSVVIPLILACAYSYTIYQTILLDDSIIDILKLYFRLDNLYTVFANESFLLFFWLHFVTVNIFLGSWVANDANRYMISKKIVALPLILIYFSGPVGLVLYWLVRIFYAKKLGFYD